MNAPSYTPPASSQAHGRATEAAPSEIAPQVFGRYLLLQRLSSGGMGEIFLAKHGLAGFETICVIKKVLPHLSRDEHFLSRFIDEAQVAIQLTHANVAQVLEVGRVDDDYFLALEFVEGCDVRRALTRLIEGGQRFPVELALMIARDVAAGLSYAHRRKDAAGQPLELVHCDISPPNIMISFEGEVKIIDFGIAKSALAGTATDPRIGFGKIGYMAPEQLVRGGRIDARTDIYATGAVLVRQRKTARKVITMMIISAKGA
jgi:serine/threonine protein kinase